MIFTRFKKTFWVICLLAAALPGFFAFAAEPGQAQAPGVDTKCANGIALQVPLGNIDCVPTLGQYLRWIYQLSISVVGLISIVMIMIGGIKWITAAGTGRIKEAQEEIFAAVMGMFILLGAYTILNFVNPELVNVGVKVPPVTLSGGFGSCITSDRRCTVVTKAQCDDKKGNYKDGGSCDLSKGACFHNDSSGNVVCDENVDVKACDNAGRKPYAGRTCSDVQPGDRPTLPPAQFCCIKNGCSVVDVPRTGITTNDTTALSQAQANCNNNGGTVSVGNTNSSMMCHFKPGTVTGSWECL